jgi:hypothetical protein
MAVSGPKSDLGILQTFTEAEDAVMISSGQAIAIA